MKLHFIKCGMYGWCMEILWTGLHSLMHGDRKLTGISSLRMFPIYSLGAFIAPMSKCLRNFHVITRGIIYMICIFSVEYISGRKMQKKGCCPWDYSHSPYHVNGVIRLDYAPLWFLAGLFFEKTGAPARNSQRKTPVRKNDIL